MPASGVKRTGPSYAALRLAGAWLTRRLAITTEGREYYPLDGPVVVAAQHYHHLYDGALLLRLAPRPLHVLAGLDWVIGRWYAPLLFAACRAAGWPVVLRPPRRGQSGGPTMGDRRAQNRRGKAHALSLLAAGHDLLVFPEGYPLIDPHGTPKHAERPHLPAQPGFARLALAASERLGRPVPVVPVTFRYSDNLRAVTVRYHPPLTASPGVSPLLLLRPVATCFQGTSLAAAFEDGTQVASSPPRPLPHAEPPRGTSVAAW